ncbi:hypothetical protein D3C86_1708810 [compost metagenome]
MVREPEVYGSVLRHKTFFRWSLCCCCGFEFRRENGWSYVSGPFLGGYGVTRYVCATCGPDRVSAGNIFDIQPWVPKRPKCAPTRAR